MVGSLAVLPSAQVQQPTHVLLMRRREQEHRPPGQPAWAMLYAARQGRLLVAVCLCEVGFSEGVPRPVAAWTAPWAWAVLVAPQVVQAPQSWTPRSQGAVTRPARSSAVRSSSGWESEGVQRARVL